MPQIEVTFDIDANGIVNVSAKDKATAKEQSIRIQANGGLSDADIDRMVKDAEANAAEDKKRKEMVEAKNHADALIHTTEKALAEHGDKVERRREVGDRDRRHRAEERRSKARTPSAIQAKTQTLVQASMKLGEAMYKAQAGGDAGEAAAPESPADEGVVDAEFEEVSDDQKSA